LPPDPFADRDLLLESLEQRLGITRSEADASGAIRTDEAQVASDGLQAVEQAKEPAKPEESALFSMNGRGNKQTAVLNPTAVQPEQGELFFAEGGKVIPNRSAEAKPTYAPRHASAEVISTDRELARLRAAKASMIRLFGQEEYERRFSGNPKVDPDAYRASLRSAAESGRHAKSEVRDDAEAFLEQFGLTPEAFDNLSREDQVKVIKGEYTAAVPESEEPAAITPLERPNNFSEEKWESMTPEQRQWVVDVWAKRYKHAFTGSTHKITPKPGAAPTSALSKAAAMGKLRAGWSQEATGRRAPATVRARSFGSRVLRLMSIVQPSAETETLRAAKDKAFRRFSLRG
jgi:hypothetical protein